MKTTYLKILLILCLSIFTGQKALSAADEDLKLEEFTRGDINLPNPFQPQLPKPAEPIPIVQPVVPEEQQPRRDRNTETRDRSGRGQQSIPATPAEQPLPDLVITGIIWNSDRPQAILNGQVVDVGDSIASAKIIGINKTGIDIQYQDQTITIKP